MSPETSIIRYLANGQSTADSLCEALDLPLRCVEQETDNLIKSGAILTGSITIRDFAITTYRLTPETIQRIAEK